MRSLGSTARAATGGFKETVSEYKGWLLLGFVAYLLWKFNGLFTSLGDAASAGAEAVTAEGKAKAEATAAAATARAEVAKAKAKVSVVAPGATDLQVEQYKAAAETIAAALGTQKGVFTMQWAFPDAQTAFSMMKNYSRLMLSNNRPWDRNTKKSQLAETPTSAKRTVNYKVLIPFYKDATGGRDLVADIKNWCGASKFQPYLKWIL